MVAGGFLFALAFVISGMLEVKLEVSEEILFMKILNFQKAFPT